MATRLGNSRDNFDLDAEIRVGKTGTEDEGAHRQRIVWDESGTDFTVGRNILPVGQLQH